VRGGAAPAAEVSNVPIVSSRTAFWITDILSDADARAFAFGRGGSLEFPFAVAARTGTSQAYRDNWTVGYTRDVTVGVWVGNFDRTELHHSSGITGAAPIFHDVMMAAATPRATILDPPANVERAPVCALSGLRPSTSCPNVEEEWIATEAPVTFCSWHHSDGVAWPAEYRAWAKTTTGAPKLAETRGPRPTASLRVTNPPDGATYLIDPTLRKSFQALRLRAISDSRVTWRIDQRNLGVAERDGFLEWPLAPGSHTITATDNLGQNQSVRIFVK
jgi:penicillin-binding protein 1C